MKRLSRWLPRIPMQYILMLTSALIFIHVIILTTYAIRNIYLDHTAQRHKTLQKIMNIVHDIKKKEEHEAKKHKSIDITKVLASFHDKNMTISITPKPLYKSQVTNPTYWSVNNKVPLKESRIEISLQLAPTQWANFAARTSDTIIDELLIIVIELAVALTLLFYIWSINRFTRPLHDFRLAAERLGVDIHTEPLTDEYKGPSIISETAEAMNSMQIRIQELLQSRTQLLAAISHDLRTPITRLKLRTDLIKDPEIARKSLRDLDEMDTMIGEILAFAKGDYSSEEKKKLELNSVLQAICDDMNDMGFAADYKPAHDAKLPFYGRPVALKRALTNLIHNAVKYGDTAHVTTDQHLGKIIITIEDEGPGIAEQSLEKVFIPFYRCELSRSREVAGTGLGLTVARDAIIAHNGTIKIKNRPEGGLQVKVILNVET